MSISTNLYQIDTSYKLISYVHCEIFTPRVVPHYATHIVVSITSQMKGTIPNIHRIHYGKH